MIKKIYVLLILIISTLLLSSCSSKNIFTFNLNEEFSEYITLGTSADYPPYEYLDTSGNNITVKGIDIELAKEIALKEKKNLRVINKDFDLLLDDLKSNKIDFVISGMNPTEERKKQVNFSDIYYEATHSILVNTNNIDEFKTIESLDKSNNKIGAQMGSTQASILNEKFNNAQSVILSDINDLIMQLIENKIDALILETPVALNYSKNNNKVSNTNIVLYEEDNGEQTGSAVAINKNNPELLNSVNEVINELKNNSRLDEIIDYYLNLEIIEESKILTLSYFKLLLQGLLMTIILALLAIFFGSIIGLFITSLRLSNNKILNMVSKVYVEVIRGTPLLVQVLLIYSFFNIPVILFLGIDLSSFIPGIIALLINSSAYVSEIFRGGINSVDKGQKEAGLALGLTEKKVMRKIILPQAIKNIIPSLGNEFVSLIKETSIFMYLGVAELMYNASIIKSETFEIKKVYIITAILYLVLTLTTTKIMSYYEKKLGVKYAK